MSRKKPFSRETNLAVRSALDAAHVAFTSGRQAVRVAFQTGKALPKLVPRFSRKR